MVLMKKPAWFLFTLLGGAAAGAFVSEVSGNSLITLRRSDRLATMFGILLLVFSLALLFRIYSPNSFSVRQKLGLMIFPVLPALAGVFCLLANETWFKSFTGRGQTACLSIIGGAIGESVGYAFLEISFFIRRCSSQRYYHADFLTQLENLSLLVVSIALGMTTALLLFGLYPIEDNDLQGTHYKMDVLFVLLLGGGTGIIVGLAWHLAREKAGKYNSLEEATDSSNAL